MVGRTSFTKKTEGEIQCTTDFMSSTSYFFTSLIYLYEGVGTSSTLFQFFPLDMIKDFILSPPQF